MKIGKQEIIGFFLMLLFVSFTVSGVALINVVFTIAPFTIYGQPVQVTVNVGFVLLLLALVTLVIILRRS